MSYEQIDAMSMADCCELFDYWSEWPPVHILTAARYLGGKRAPHGAPVDQTEFTQSLTEVSGMLGMPTEPMPPQLKAMGDWAEEQIKLMHSGKRV